MQRRTAALWNREDGGFWTMNRARAGAAPTAMRNPISRPLSEGVREDAARSQRAASRRSERGRQHLDQAFKYTLSRTCCNLVLENSHRQNPVNRS